MNNHSKLNKSFKRLSKLKKLLSNNQFKKHNKSMNNHNYSTKTNPKNRLLKQRLHSS